MHSTSEEVFERKLKMDKKQILWLIVCVILYYWIALTEGIIKSIGIFLVGAAFFMLYKLLNRQKVETKVKVKIIQILQFIGFGGLVVWMLASKYMSLTISRILMYIFVFSIIISVWLRKDLPSNGRKDMKLEERIKDDLKITVIKKEANFPKWLNWIGGFVMPILPFFFVLNKKWKKKLNDEAIIHENVHLYYLQNGAILWLLVFIVVFHMALSSITTIFSRYPTVIILMPLVIAVTFFEYITFNRTNKYGEKLGIKTRKWNSKICVKYLLVYSVQFVVIIGILKLVQFIWGLIW